MPWGPRRRDQEALAVLQAGLGPAPRGPGSPVGFTWPSGSIGAACRTLRVKRQLCGIRCSNDKSCVESFCAAIDREVLAREPDVLPSLAPFRDAMAQFAWLYSTERPLGTMGYRTPRELADRGALTFTTPRSLPRYPVPLKGAKPSLTLAGPRGSRAHYSNFPSLPASLSTVLATIRPPSYSGMITWSAPALFMASAYRRWPARMTILAFGFRDRAVMVM